MNIQLFYNYSTRNNAELSGAAICYLCKCGVRFGIEKSGNKSVLLRIGKKVYDLNKPEAQCLVYEEIGKINKLELSLRLPSLKSD